MARSGRRRTGAAAGAEKEFIRAIAGKREWTDYTLTSRRGRFPARKVSCHFASAALKTASGWNIGGWVNSADGIEAGGTLDSKPAHRNRPLVRPQAHRERQKCKCWMDGNLIHDVNYDLTSKVASLYSSRHRREDRATSS